MHKTRATLVIISGAVPSKRRPVAHGRHNHYLWQENKTAIETAGPFHVDSKSGVGGVSSEGEASCSNPQKEPTVLELRMGML